MFADFFIEPLLRKDNIDKEINAIDSESTKNLLSSEWISLEMIKKCLFDDYPINHYTCGTKNTLNVKNNEILMRDFFEKYYSSNLMHLILFVNNKFTESDLLKFLDKSFVNITNKNVILNEKYGNIIKPNQIVKYIPVTDIDTLTICTELPVLHKNLMDNPIDFLFWILSNKTNNSLYDILKKYEYINDMICDTLFNYDDYMLCVVKFILTEKGYEHLEHIIQIYFEYIQSIKTSKKLESIYNDSIKYHTISYKFPVNTEITDTLMNFSYILNNNVEPQNLLNYKINLKSYDDMKLSIDDTLSKIKLYNSSFVVGSKKNVLKKYFIDEIYKIKYICSNIEPIKINKGIYDIISCNKYINDDIKLIEDNDIYPNKDPIKIDTNYILYYNFNSSFNVPDVNIYTMIELNDVYDDPKTYLYFILYLDTLNEIHMNTLNEINFAGYNLKFDLDEKTLYLYINGNNKNIYDIVNDCDKIFNNTSKINKKIYAENIKSFNMICEKIKKYLDSFVNTSVIHKINQLIYKKLYLKYYTSYDLLKYFETKINFDDCKKIFFDVLKNINSLSILISGNISKSDVPKLGDKIYNIFNANTQNKISFKSYLKHLDTPYIRNYYNYNKDDKNCFFTLIYKLFKTRKNHDKDYSQNIIFLMLLDSITSIQYFNIFRTNKQYGYVVYTKINYLGNKNLKIGCIKFVIQSPVKTSIELYNETITYIKNDLYKFIENLGEEGIDEYKKGLMSTLTNKFNNLNELDIYLCSQIFDYSYDFDYKKKLIKELELMSFDKFKQIYSDLILNKNDIYSISINPYIKNNSDDTHKF